MKPQTLETVTAMSIKAITDELKPLADATFGAEGYMSGNFRDFATNCRNIADVAEALENIFQTAADEQEKIEAAADEQMEEVFL